MKSASLIVVLVLMWCVCACAGTLTATSVTCTGEYNGGSYYGCGGLIDGVTDDTVLGPTGNASYWLGREYPYAAPYLNETFTVDLGTEALITGFDIFNTHNGQNPTANDRGTLGFTIWVSQDPVTPDTTSPSFGTDVLDNTPLTFYPGVNPNPDQFFAITPTAGEYVTFRATNVGDLASAGLSELEVDGSLPEPATFVLAGIALVGMAAIRRRRQVA